MSRPAFERACRLLALMALLIALVSSWRTGNGRAARPAGRVALQWPDSLLTDTGAAALAPLRAALVARGARSAAVPARAGDTLQLPLSVVPASPTRAALASVRAAGVPLQWYDGTAARGLAAWVSRVAAPGAPLDVRVAAAHGHDDSTALVLRDAGGTLDSIARARGVSSWRLANAAAPLRVQQGRNTVTLDVPDSLRTRRVLVMAQPGWEGKFVVAALEEAGWKVDGTMRVSPSGATTVGNPQRLDTARYAVAVVLDSMSVDAPALTRFVMRGGGLVLGGDALRIPALASLRPARTSVLRGAIAGALLTESPRRGLEAWELVLAPNAVVLAVDQGDHDHDEPALVARRAGAGRVVAMPYHETWRWRLQGTDDGMPEHRAWWHAAVAAAVGVGAPPAMPGTVDLDPYPGGAAPYADLVARVGGAADASVPPVTRATAGDARASGSDIPVWRRPWVLLLASLLSLLAEWSSRRLRGAR